MRFPHLVGQQRTASILERALLTGRFSHAYLFLGPGGVGKEAAALDFARALLCETTEEPENGAERTVPCENCDSCAQSRIFHHPNLRILFPLPKPKETADNEPGGEYSKGQQQKIADLLSLKSEDYYYPLKLQGAREILVEHIRGLRREFRLTSFSGSHRVVLVSQADRLRVQAANAFLKLLEEPPPGVIFLLTSSRESKLLPTIVSRCQTLRFPPLGEREIATALRERLEMDEKQAVAAAKLAAGSWWTAREWAGGDPAEELRKVVDLFRLLVQGDPGALDVEVDRLAAGNADNLAGMLALMIYWLRSVQRLDAFKGDAESPGEDDPMVRFARYCTGRDFAEALEAVDEARLDLEKRVQPALIAHTLFIRLRRILFNREPSAV